LKYDQKPVGTHENNEVVLKMGKKIEGKTPTIDKISELYGWLREEYVSKKELKFWRIINKINF